MGPIMSTLDEMRVFACVVQLGSFAAAAQKLGRTPSAISKTIDRLETRLAVQLIVADVHRTTATRSASWHGRLLQDNDPHDLTASKGW